jgi:predicted LPLAT superfamily acyltransferase
MPSWQGKSRGNRLGYSIFVQVLKNLGVLPAYFLLRFVALYYFLFSYKTSRLLYEFFHSRLGYGRWSSLCKIYRNYYLFGQTLIDKVVVMTGMANRFSYHFDGEENLHKMAELSKGGLLLSAHIGSWEIAGHLLKRLGTKIHIVMYDGEQQQIKEYLASVTGERNAHIIVIKKDLTHIYEINEALKNNELVCIHADRHLENTKTMQGSFLGSAACFPAGPFILAATSRVPVSFVFALKESNLHYHFYASVLKEYPVMERKAVVDEILDDFTRAMEEKVKKYPEQWYNYFNFWER